MRSCLLEAMEKPLDVALWQADDTELLADLTDLLAISDRIAARLAATITEARTRGLADYGDRVRTDILIGECAAAPIGRSAARALAHRAWVRSELPLVAGLHDLGLVSTAFLDAAGRGLDRLPHECRAVIDDVLAGDARGCDPADVNVLVRQVRATVDPDGVTARAKHLDGKSQVSISPVGNEGAYAIDGVLYGLDAERVHAIVHGQAELLRRGGDLRGPAERRASALFEIFGLAERVAADPTRLRPPHGADVHVTLLATLAAWQGEPGAPAAITSAGNLIDPGTLAAVRCSTPTPDILIATTEPTGAGAADSGMPACPTGHQSGSQPDTVAAVTDAQLLTRSLSGLVASPGAYRLVPLAYGRAARTASRAQWEALVARDRHCVDPGCHAPPGRCQAHHLREYDADTGEADLPNMALVCTTGHTRLHRTGEHLHPPWCTCHPDATTWTLHTEAPQLP